MRELWEWVSKKLYNKKKEREGGGRRKCIFKQEKHLLFKMSAGANSRGNANESLGQSQYLSNYTPTPPLTMHQQPTDDKLMLG